MEPLAQKIVQTPPASSTLNKLFYSILKTLHSLIPKYAPHLDAAILPRYCTVSSKQGQITCYFTCEFI